MPLFENNVFGVRDLIILQSHINGIDSFQLTQDQLITAGITGDLDVKLNSIADDILLTANANVIYRGSDGNLVHRAEVNGSLYIQSEITIKDDVYSVEITGSNVTSIGISAFFGYSNLTSFTIPDSVTSIGRQAFYASGLTSITIPDAVQTIGLDAFFGCERLESVTIGNSVTSIGERAFKFCKKLTSLEIPNSVETVGAMTFENCEAITSITLPTNDNFTTIGDDTFANCYELTEITIPDSVTSIGDRAFNGCSKLATIYMSDTTRSNLGIASFVVQSYKGSPSSTEIANVNANVIFRDSNSDVLHRAEVTGGLNNSSYYGITKTDIVSVEITGSNVTSIGSYAFYGCSSLASVTIPDSVTSIGVYAFYGCSSLASVTIPDSVETIGDGAFYICSSLASVTIPDSVRSIGINVFYQCSNLASVTIGNSVTGIGNYAFHGCSSLATIYMSDTTRSNLGIASFGEQSYKGSPSTTKIANVNANVIFRDSNSDVLHRAEVTGELNSTSYTGITKTDIVSVEITGSLVTSLGSLAFYQCSNLASVTIPDSVTSLGNNAFEACSSLASVTIPDSVESIGYAAFNNCTSLASVTIGNSVESIGDYAFNNCSSLASVTIPDSVTSISSYAFLQCSSLNTVYMSDSLRDTLNNSYGLTLSFALNQYFFGVTTEIVQT